MEDAQKRRRKVPRRFQDEDEDEDIPKATQTTRRKKAARDPEFAEEPDKVRLYEEEQEEDDWMASSHKIPVKLTKGRAKLKGDGPPSRKKARNVVVSDEDEDDYLEAEAVPEEEDYHISSDDEKSRVTKGKGKVADGRGKKRKAKADPVSSPHPTLERTMSSDLRSNKKARPILKLDESLLEGDIASTPELLAKTSPDTLKTDSPLPQLKKIKLPQIKKNKTQGGATGTSTPTSATPVTAKPRLPLDIGGAKKTDIRKVGADLDLSNKSIYQELFKTGSDGGASRTGLNRRAKEEERRKELNKLKEEYLAKRAKEEAHSFDLQARHEKIMRFEDKLRYMRSAALFPNHMAAKWKEVYERERKKEKGWNENGSANGKEEGEVK